MLGMVGLVIFKANQISDYVKENIGISIYLKEDIKDIDITRLNKSLEASRYVKSAEFISKDQAAQQLQEDIGEDFIQFLGSNPLSSSIDIKLNAAYAHPDSIKWIEKELIENPKVKEVYYLPDLINQVNENVQKISFILVFFAGILLIIAIALINSTIRLAIYSQRFLIRSMQLVGATQLFIRRPFLSRAVLHGVYAAMIAILGISAIIFYFETEFPEVFRLNELSLIIPLYGSVILLGILISWVSTFLAVTKYLRLRTEQLYK